MNDKDIKLVLLDDALSFIGSLPLSTRKKIYYNIDKVLFGERDAEIFKKLEGTNLWEFRTLYDKKAYRLFAFWDNDEETFIVATHGMVKKSQKTPRKELEKAERLRQQYFNDKKAK